MWCTRWFLPLLLLPLPTAPPYFLILFLFSLTMHAKPCFYCIVLLTTLFISSCYWQPFPMDSPLTTPWSENITTFAEALNTTIKSNYSQPLPTVMRAVDRCWCDFSAGGFFEPFNVSHWEYLSVKRLTRELERQMTLEDNSTQENIDGRNGPQEAGLTITEAFNLSSSTVPSTSPTNSKFWWLRRPFYSKPAVAEIILLANHTPVTNSHDHNTIRPSTGSSTPSPESLPLLRSEYDLRPYGLGMIIDFAWSR